MEPYYIKCIKDDPFQPKNYDIMESVISCVSEKETWTDLVHSFEGPSDTKENRIMDLKLEYQTFRAKPTKSLSQTYTRYKTLLNELANDGVNLSKHEINVVNNYSSVSKGFQPKFTQKLIQSSSNSNNQANPKFQKDYKAEYKKMKAKLALLEASPSNEEEVSDKEEVTQVKVLMALADDELTVGKSHARNGEWVDIQPYEEFENYNAMPDPYGHLLQAVPEAKCEICGSYDHSTSRYNHVIQIRGGVLVESSQSNESSIGVKCNTCGSIVHSTSDQNEFDHFKRETHQGANLVPRQWMLKEYDWCQELSAQICRAAKS
ncbi:hypothetical protein Tco_0827724 [Tanacetum coccineum]